MCGWSVRRKRVPPSLMIIAPICCPSLGYYRIMVVLSNVKRKISKEKSLIFVMGKGPGVLAVDEGRRLHGLRNFVDRTHVPLS